MSATRKKNHRIWYVLKLKDKMTIGRDPGCDIVVSDRSISKIHLKIDREILSDANSTNGTFVQSKRIENHRMQVLDHIQFGSHEAYFIPGYWIVTFPVKDNTIDSSKLKPFNRPSTKAKELPNLDLIHMTMEVPQALPEVEKISLLQTIGPSFLILSSGLISSLTIGLMMPEQNVSFFSMGIQSLSMCCAFSLYGLFQRGMQRKSQISRRKTMEQTYLDYCYDFKRKVEEKEECYRKKVQCWKDHYGLNEENFQNGIKEPFALWVSLQEIEWISIEIQRPNYLMHRDKLVLHQQKILEEIHSTSESLIFVCNKESVAIRNAQLSLDFLFCQWVLRLYSSTRRWVWIMSSYSYTNRYLYHPGSILITTQEEWNTFIDKHDPTLHYTFWCMENFATKGALPEGTWIFEDNQNGYDVPNMVVHENFYRKLLYFQHSDHPGMLEKLIKSRSDRVNLKVSLSEDIDLDLLEGCQGPHGFLAGRTGSGKSELLFSILLQLCVQNSPDLFQYILVDFKGGAFGLTFYEFAHCQGYLTNLELDHMRRFMAWLTAFVEERQRELIQFLKEHPKSQAHIEAYNDLSKRKMAHVLIVIDELAQVKSIFPEFMDRIKEIARIGRSLGIHVLLSTQKPLGIIDDQVQANTSFKICMQVANRQDSLEVLGNDLALSLKRPGEFILQCLGEPTKKGRAFYMREKVPVKREMFQEVDPKGKSLTHQKTKMILEILSSKVEKRKKNQPWIIYPFEAKSFHKEIALIDDYQNLALQEFVLPQKLLVYCPSIKKRKRLIECIASSSKIPVYGENLDSKEMVKVLSEILEFKKNCIFFLSLDVYRLPESKILDNSLVQVVVFCSEHERNVPNFDFRICMDYRDLDDVRNFFGIYNFLPGNFERDQGYILYGKELKMILFRYAEKSKKNNDVPFIKCESSLSLLLGFDSYRHKEILWNPVRKLLIGFVQPSVRNWILRWISIWQKKLPLKVGTNLEEDSDLYVIDFQESCNLLSLSSCIGIIYDMDIVWIGKGIKENIYHLKREPPNRQGSLIAWINDNLYVGEPLWKS